MVTILLAAQSDRRKAPNYKIMAGP
jgi:hypothetical protein